MSVDREQARRDEHDYIARTIATVRNQREAHNCWPQWANHFADEIERQDTRICALLAELEQAERDRDEARGETVAYQRLWHRDAELMKAWQRHAATSDKEVSELREQLKAVDLNVVELAGTVRLLKAQLAKVPALVEALRAIEQNADAWHGPPPDDSGHVRALNVNGQWAHDALATWREQAQGETP